MPLVPGEHAAVGDARPSASPSKMPALLHQAAEPGIGIP